MPWIAKANSKNIADAAGKDSRKTGDVLTIYNQLPKQSEREKLYWDLVEISEEEAKQFRDTRAKVKDYYRAESTEWTDKFPAIKEGWEDKDGSVYELKEKPFLTVTHDIAKGFSLSIDPSAKNKESLLIAAKKEDKK